MKCDLMVGELLAYNLSLGEKSPIVEASFVGKSTKNGLPFKGQPEAQAHLNCSSD